MKTLFMKYSVSATCKRHENSVIDGVPVMINELERQSYQEVVEYDSHL